ncbi:MAG: methyltransferase domain-containing protein [Anaerolineae bacterium]
MSLHDRVFGHIGHKHGSPGHGRDTAPHTEGRTIGWARHYDAVVTALTMGRAGRIREATVDLARIQPGDAVLDVGCGTGDLTLAAKSRAGASGLVCGIDAAPEMIEVAKEKAKRAGADVTFQVNTIEALPFADATFDVVLSSLMMHHLPDTLKRQGLAEVRRVLKPGGRLLILDFKRPTSERGRILTAAMMHSHLDTGVQDLPPLLQEAGFEKVESGDLEFSAIGFGVIGYAAGQTVESGPR